MSAHNDVTEDDLITDQNWFFGLSFAMVFALVWVIIGESDVKMLFAAITFVLFLRAGVNYETTSRALSDHH